MKKALGIFVLSMFIISMSMGIVSAGPVEQINNVIKGVYDVFKPFLSAVIGETQGTEVFFAKVLFLIIVFGIVWTALSKITFFSENNWVLWTISAAVSIVSIRWMGKSEIINNILLPYSALGIALTAGLPFVVYFLLVNSFKSRTLRKTSWVFFIVIFVGLWILRSGDSAAPKVTGFAWIYLITAGLSLAVLMFDGTIQKIMNKSKIERIRASYSGKLAGDMKDEMRKLQARYRADPDNYTSSFNFQGKGDKVYKKDMDRIGDILANMGG